MGGGSKPAGNTTTTTTSEPWAGQKPFLEEQMRYAQGLYNTKTPQYDNDAYNQALGQWNTTNSNQQNDYRKLVLRRMGYQGGFENESAGARTWLEENNKLNDYLGQFADKPEGWNRGINPEEMSEAQQYGLMAGARPELSNFLIPGTENSTALAPAYYPNQTIADQSPETLAAQNMTTQRALEGSPVMNQAKGYLSDVMGGNYLNPDSNPYMSGYLNNALDKVRGQVNSSFAQGGGFGGSANQEILARELGKTATGILAPAYESERNRMQQSLLFAPQMAQSDYFDLGQLANVGMQKEGRAQDLINADIDKWNYEGNLGSNALRNYISLTGGNYGGTSTATSPYYQNRGAGVLGGALGGASLAGGLGLGSMSTLPWLSAFGPAGLAGGALLGGLMGGL
jgi:hypothetical protein